MYNQIELPQIWSRGIRFKVYQLDSTIEYKKVAKCLSNYSGNTSNQKEGWLTEYPYFKTDDSDVAAFLYVTFKRDAGASRVKREEIRVPEYVSCNYFFKENLVIVSTSSGPKLSNLVEKKMFGPIRALARIDPCGYSGDFLYWLAYKHDRKEMKITDNIHVADIQAISSEREQLNVSDAVSANTKVTSHIEAQVLLALYGFANGASVSINADKKDHHLKLLSDGRIYAKHGLDIETNEDKAMYALYIHQIIQECYREYSIDKEGEEWEKNKKEYRQSLFKKSIGTLSDLVKGFEKSADEKKN